MQARAGTRRQAGHGKAGRSGKRGWARQGRHVQERTHIRKTDQAGRQAGQPGQAGKSGTWQVRHARTHTRTPAHTCVAAEENIILK